MAISSLLRMSPKQPYALARDIAFQNHNALSLHKPKPGEIVVKEISERVRKQMVYHKIKK